MSVAPYATPEILGLLDIGTSKIVCLLLARSGSGGAVDAGSADGYRVIGFGHQKSRGLKASVVIDADAAEDAVRATVAQAEQMAGTSMVDTVLSAACGRISSIHVTAAIELTSAVPGGRMVTPPDIERLMDAGRAHAECDDRAALDVGIINCNLDGRRATGSALGQHASRLSTDMHVVTADRSQVRHLLHVAERCQLRVVGIAPAPMACALAVTTAEERRRGVSVVEFGAGTTGLAVYVAGSLVCAHVFPIGSNHLTFDLTRALGTTITEAERIKKNYAIQFLAHPAADDTVSYQPRGIDHAETPSDRDEMRPAKQVTRAAISSLLTSRLDALLRQVLRRIDDLAIPTHLRGPVVVSGGGSELGGLLAYADGVMSRWTNCGIRLGVPLPETGLPRALLRPAFSTVAGLSLIARDRRLGLRLDTERSGRTHDAPRPAPALRRSF